MTVRPRFGTLEPCGRTKGNTAGYTHRSQLGFQNPRGHQRASARFYLPTRAPRLPPTIPENPHGRDGDLWIRRCDEGGLVISEAYIGDSVRNTIFSHISYALVRQFLQLNLFKTRG